MCLLLGTCLVCVCALNLCNLTIGYGRTPAVPATLHATTDNNTNTSMCRPHVPPCSSSITPCRQSDYVGGCNGAYIRLEPQRSWPSNKGLDQVLSVLEPVFDKHPTLSYADLIVLAGTVSVAHAAEQAEAEAAEAAAVANKRGAAAAHHLFSFCPERSDAALVGEEPLDYLAPRTYKTAHIAFRCVRGSC